MARKRKHEDHTNHEAWAIPYGDLITLLLAFFVVMYAISSVNEGKFRVLSDSLSAAFNGQEKSMKPVQIGERSRGTGLDDKSSSVQPTMVDTQSGKMVETMHVDTEPGGGAGPMNVPGAGQATGTQPPPQQAMTQQLTQVADELEGALQPLIAANLVNVRRHGFWLEVEVKTDILFPSGVATLSNRAIPALDALATTLVKYPNPVRVEGHTDNRPIASKVYPSNWELSAARAASVVHRFANAGVNPDRLSVIGFGEYRPLQPNDTPAHRDANRRVVIVILAGNGSPAAGGDADQASEANSAQSPVALPPYAAQGAAPNATPTQTTPQIPVAVPPTAAVGTETAPLPVNLNVSAGNPARE
ncbi:MAG TPA: flagellar motor protein MotD [Steroidobacteraceae bacterium]|nr:flagellar motor protein MotD [Steroidobacteraceae bacterium]